jgi:hypothetical protein
MFEKHKMAIHFRFLSATLSIVHLEFIIMKAVHVYALLSYYSWESQRERDH